ncbi:MAG: type II secretion system protein [Oscillatoriales cyanobacterium SM2_1_8]|nr:type II secretion system protein [Oscillatoriales cyanobacterium SM2_1_8]
MLQAKPLPTQNHPDAGFSLVESLLAVVVTGIIFVALATAAAISVGVRVQARRIDLANQAARSYIDGVRSGILDTAGFPPAIRFDLTATGGFSGLTPITAAQLNDANFQAAVQGIRVDTNGNGFSFNDPNDLVIQPMRSSFVEDPGPPKVLEAANFPKSATELTAARTSLERGGFTLAVRVYRADAFGGAGGPILTTANTAATVLSNNASECSTNFSSSKNIALQGGLPNKQCPLAVQTAQVFLSTGNFRELQQNLNQ